MEAFSKAYAVAKQFGDAISRTAASAQELLRDQELRNKGIQTVLNGAQTRLQGLQSGLVQRAGRWGERFQDNKRQLVSLLMTLEERLSSSRKAWDLQASRRQKVDVQFGRQLIADAPQEVRVRLWYVLLENPNLAAPIKCQHAGPVPNRPAAEEDPSVSSTSTSPSRRGGPGPGFARSEAGGPGAEEPGSPYAGAGAGRGPGAEEEVSSSGSSLAAVAAAALGFGRSSGGGGVSFSSASATRGQPQTPRPRGPGPLSPASPLATPSSGRQRADGPGTPAASGLGEPLVGDDWELVGAGGVGGLGLGLGGPGPSALDLIDGTGSASSASAAALAAAHPEAVRLIVERLEALGPLPLDESGSDPVLVAQQAVLEAMLQVPWVAGAGLPPNTSPETRFAMLNEMTEGQEEVDESILRDIHRTFPEHPYFSLDAGQQALFRVLKAYSLHDLEVAYCQGMAFMAGVLLMYVPDEMAF
ncbi:hypothetical protein HYH03_018746, partial [Edaphochlamys debaryana]